MTLETFSHESELHASAAFAFAWHERPGAFERLQPPWEKVRLLRKDAGIQDGARVELASAFGPLWLRWEVEHQGYQEGRRFEDHQRRGPFREWRHTHAFEALGEDRCLLRDAIEYRLPGGAPGRLLLGKSTRRRLERMFRYRHWVTRHDVELLAARAPMTARSVAVSGSTGLVGSALLPLLRTRGHHVLPLLRRAAAPAGAIAWDPVQRRVDRSALEGLDAVVHLAGENIAARRWSRRQKERIRASRVEGTRFLAETLAALDHPPRVLVCASAVGYYGDRGDEELREDAAPGTGFLAQVCREWEEAGEPAARAGIRVVNLRLGVVLAPRGGALARMLLPFRLGLGGRLGSGRQFLSWIALPDVVEIVEHALWDETLQGPVNAVAPGPVTNQEFTETLASVLHRPAPFLVPALAARAAFGELADALLLSSCRAVPAVLQRHNYRFCCAGLGEALHHLLMP